MKKNLFWLVPVCLVLILGGVILSTPAFVASHTHRANIEALASSLTGRQVHISGNLSLALFPSPQLSATQVTITGPDEETISARGLTLNISLPALLRGRLVAENLELDAPDIAFPWPLPGGPTAIAPPGWLAALHAHLSAGRISLGAARFSGVDADIVTGADGTVNVSGTGTIFGQDVALNLAVGAAELTGAAPVAVSARSGDAALFFKGVLDAQSVLTGQLGLRSAGFSGTAGLVADGASASASDLQFTAGKASGAGSAVFSFTAPSITAKLDARNLNLDTLPLQLPPIPVAVTLTASGVAFDGMNLPGVTGDVQATPRGASAKNLQVLLPANAGLTASGAIRADGALSGTVSLASPDLAGMLAGYGFSPPADWTSARLSTSFSGTTQNITFTPLSGTLGASHVSGALRLSGRHVTGALDFDRLDLLPILTAFGRLPAGAFTADGQVAAAVGSLGPVPLKNLLLDGALGKTLILRRVSANVLDGLAAGSVSLDPDGHVSDARGFVFLPSAAPLNALLPAGWQLPAGVVKPRLNAAFFARQDGGWLTGSVMGSLGDFSITAAPSLNLAGQTVEGAVTLRHPDAIAAFKLAGLPAGLDWPGPGSISLRASFLASPDAYGLPDFVLSLGNLTADGRLLSTHGVLTGEIDAGTLALPPVPADWQVPWGALANAKGGVKLAADRVMYDGNTILLGSEGAIQLAPDDVALKVAHAALAGGDASGSFEAKASPSAPPAIAVHVSATGVDAARLDLPVKFPFGVSEGLLGGTANLTASGYAPNVWLATLGGNASLTVSDGAFNGLSLAGLAKGLTSKNAWGDMRAALAGGSTKFVTLALGATLSHGIATLGTASLRGTEGTMSATGSIDIFDQDVAVHLSCAPAVAPPIAIGTAVIGGWAAPRQYPKLKPALGWKPALPAAEKPPP